MRHRTLREGTVRRVEDGRLTILFDESGYETLSTDRVLESGLLETVERSGTSSGR